MKIIEIIPQLSSGGAERFVVDLCNELIKNHFVILIVLHKLDGHDFFLKDLSSKVRVISMNKRKGLDILLFFRLYRTIKKLNPDIVHTHLRGIVYSFFAYIFHSSSKYIHTVHNDAKVEAGNWFSRNIRRIAFKAKRVCPVTISEESCRSFIDFYKCQPSLIYNGRPSYFPFKEEKVKKAKNVLDSIKSKKESLIIVNVARIQPQKNQLALAIAIDEINKKGYDLELAILGAKNDLDIVAKIENLKSPFIHLLGTESNVRDFIYVADGFCLSSLYEGMPITLIECFSVGTIPICTAVGGIKNMIVNGKNGLLAVGLSQVDIEKSLEEFVKLNASQRLDMQKASLASFENYNIINCATKYTQLMKDLLKIPSK